MAINEGNASAPAAPQDNLVIPQPNGHSETSSISPLPTSQPSDIPQPDARVNSSTLSNPDTNTINSIDQNAVQQQAVSAPVLKEDNTRVASIEPPSMIAIKDEAADSPSGVGSSGYGTRSRNRTGTRPNYADDNDMDYEFMVSKPVPAPSKRSTPSETTLNFQAPIELAATPTNSTDAVKLSNGDAAQIKAPVSDATPKSASELQSEKKKRKFEKANVAKAPATEARPPLTKEQLPGTSQFFVTSSTGSDAPPTKKRKTGDTAAVASQSPAPTVHVLGQRKGSSNHVTKSGARPSCIVTFERTGARLQDGKLVADDDTVYAVGDNAYLICEPPGEPYYLCRIMDFRHIDPEDTKSSVVSMLVNWFYRPKDIGKYSIDPRCLYASMQSDESPITSLRGKCEIKHRSEIESLDEYRKRRDTFYFFQLFDRYIKRPYEMVPVSAVINVPEEVKRALDERWKFLAVEPARMKELTSAVKLCKRCNRYCAPNDSVDCGVCRDTWHMNCVRPALTRKPTRGFAWSCGACSRAQERRLEERHTAVIPAGAYARSRRGDDTEAEDEVLEDEEAEPGTIVPKPDPASMTSMEIVPEVHSEDAIAKLWPWRYLGIHCKVEDVLQFDDRAIYPRATSRLGPRHEAVVLAWPGQPVQFVKPLEVKRKSAKGSSKKDSKLSKEALAAIEADKLERANRPKWVQDEPPGYIARGEDLDDADENNTCKRLFVLPEDPKPAFAAANAISSNSKEQTLDGYMTKARGLAKQWGISRTVHPGTHGYNFRAQEPRDIVPTNFLDQALQLLYKHKYDAAAALEELRTRHSPKDLGDPEFSKEELKKFGDAVAKFGSDLRTVKKAVKTKTYGDIVRFFYTWKKTEQGQPIWGQSGGRSRIRKKAEASWTEIADEEDDSAFDNDKAVTRKRKFQCKNCLTKTSRQWRRAPNIAPGAFVLADPKGNAKDKSNQLVVALCERCAVLWRRYAMKWDDIEEFAKAVIQAGGRAWKRKSDEDMLRELVMANEIAGVVSSPLVIQAAAMLGITVTVVPIADAAKKKLKAGQDKENSSASPAPDGQVKKKEKAVPPPPPPRPPTPPIEPAEPKWRELPCAVCQEFKTEGDVLCTCSCCKLTVHKRCYAINEQSNTTKWVCDTCLNDKNNQASLDYECVLCPVHDRPMELVEPPKVSHRKKTDREREKERLEKQLVDDLINKYFKEQQEKGRPQYPREAVKRTASNNWMHIVCSIWMPEIRFSEGAKLENAEGMLSAVTNPARIDTPCKLCRKAKGACVSCQQCHAAFHVACAQEAGYTFGFDVTPVKGSRKDQVQTVTLGEETGYMTAAIWCKEHTVKTVLHPINEIVKETGLTALQTYVRTFKQADRSLTGTARKANLYSQQSARVSQVAAAPAPLNRRASLLASTKTRSTPPIASEEVYGSPAVDGLPPTTESKHRCVSCKTQTSFQWYPVEPPQGTVQVNGFSSSWQCHKCHIMDKLGTKPSSIDLDGEDVETLPSQLPDFFELTAPRPSAQPVTNGQPRAPNTAGLDPYTLSLWESTVYLTNLTGQTHALNGKIFGRLDDNPIITWTFFSRHVSVNMGFDAARHAFITEEGKAVRNSRSLITALGDMLLKGKYEAKWYMTDNPPEVADRTTPTQPFMNQVLGPPPIPIAQGPTGPQPQPHQAHYAASTSFTFPPPPPPQLQHQQQPQLLPRPSIEHPTTPTTSAPLGRTPSTSSLHQLPPPLQQSQPLRSPSAHTVDQTSTSSRASMGYFPPPQQGMRPRSLTGGGGGAVVQGQSQRQGQMMTPGLMPGSTSPLVAHAEVNVVANRPERASTPREQMGGGTGAPGSTMAGASSSPSLKHLVH